MAGDADARGIHIGQACDQLHGSVNTDCSVVKICLISGFRISVTVHVKGNDHIAAAGKLDAVQILHFLVVVPALHRHHGRGRILLRSSLRFIQGGAEQIAFRAFPAHILYCDFSSAGLNLRGTYRADKTQDKGHNDPEFCVQFDLHFSLFLSLISVVFLRSERCSTSLCLV